MGEFPISRKRNRAAEEAQLMADGINVCFVVVTAVNNGFREEVLFSPHGELPVHGNSNADPGWAFPQIIGNISNRPPVVGFQSIDNLNAKK